MSIKLKDEILDAIDQLRRRKARPDAERICNLILRKQKLDPKEIKSDLAKLVDHELVIRVPYKGSISYRNAAKWPRYNVCKKKPEAAASLVLWTTSEKTRQVLHNALAVLIRYDEDYKKFGVPYDQLQKYLVELDDELNVRFREADYLDAVIALEINHENVEILLSGNFIPSPKSLYPLETGTIDFVKFSRSIVRPEALDNVKKTFNIPKGVAVADCLHLAPKNRKICQILSLCKTLHDAETRRRNRKAKQKLIQDDFVLIDNNEPENSVEEQGASPSTGGSSQITASRIGSRQKRARQVFDPSDNNLPRASRVPSKKSKTISNSASSSNKQGGDEVTTPKSNKQQSSPISSGEQQVQTPQSSRRRLNIDEITSEIETQTPTKNIHSPAQKNKSASKFIKSSSPDFNTGSSDSEILCYICHDDSYPNRNIVTCKSCDRRAHVNCLKEINNLTFQPYGKNSVNWKCMACTTCIICSKGCDKNKSDWMVVCTSCNDGYHALCHSPALIKKPAPSYKWLCYRCIVETAVSTGLPRIINYSDKFISHSVPVFHTPNIKKEPKFNDNLNVQMWNSDAVMDYFKSKGFDEESAVFKQQDIDGKSLLLMQRNDIVKTLGFKLGPALKIFNLVKDMQTYFNDF